jgi:hypothetical protein
MMNLLEILVINFVASGIICSIFAYLLRRNIAHHYDKKLESFKAELSIAAKVREKLLTKKLDIYPALSALVYKTRNLARDILERKDAGNLFELIENEFYSLENALYQYRLEIEEDDFALLHKYKNLLRSYISVGKKVYEKKSNSLFTPDHLSEMYNDINTLYQTIIEKLKTTYSNA